MVELNTWAGLEPAVMDIKTVSGLAQVFELTLTDSTGSVVDLEGVTSQCFVENLSSIVEKRP